MFSRNKYAVLEIKRGKAYTTPMGMLFQLILRSNSLIPDDDGNGNNAIAIHLKKYDDGGYYFSIGDDGDYYAITKEFYCSLVADKVAYGFGNIIIDKK